MLLECLTASFVALLPSFMVESGGTGHCKGDMGLASAAAYLPG